MNNLNSILIEGNLVKNAAHAYTENGSSVCKLTIASNRFFRGKDGLEKEVSFVNIEAWGKLVENCLNLGNKGRGVRVVGRLKQSRWTSADGKPRSRIYIVAEHVEFRPEFKKEPSADEDADTSENTKPAETLVPDYR